MLVWVGGDLDKASTTVATGDDEFTIWHREQLRDISGIDLTAPPAAPAPATLLDWRA